MSTKKLQIVNSVISTDNTLTQSGVAADAKYVGDKLAEMDNKIVTSLRPPPAVTSYSRPTQIPIISGMQIVFYAACAGTMSFTMGSKVFSHELASVNDVGWALWVQTGDTDGSFIFPSGSRKYLETGETVSESTVSFTYDTSAYEDPNYIVITIE